MTGQSERWVIGIGGNALADPHDRAGLAHQEAHARQLAGPIADVLERGVTIAIVHGNGPQVGARLAENEAARADVPRKPLQTLVAETQGEIGHYLTLALANALRRRKIERKVVALLTHVLVDLAGPELHLLQKPVGPSYTMEQGRSLEAEMGWRFSEQRDSGWRRVVPSPPPLRILEQTTILQLLDSGHCVIAGGGGGIPVATTATGLVGIEAVVDKDYVASILATALGATRLIVLTDVPGAALSFATPQQRFIDRMTCNEARSHLNRGEFAPGSMAPKVEACADFVGRVGTEAVIASIADAAIALSGHAGTRLIPTPRT
jgi:carbamate kinase